MVLAKLVMIGDMEYERNSPVAKIIFLEHEGRYMFILEDGFSFAALPDQFVPVTLKERISHE